MAKKAVKKKKPVSEIEVIPSSMNVASKKQSCCSKSEDVWLCSISLIAFVFFLMSAFSALGLWIIQDVRWWVWLLISIIFGLKPLMNFSKK